MNQDVETNCRTLLTLLSCHDAESAEIEEDMMPVLRLALTDPKAYLAKFPDDAWLATGFDLQTFDPKLAQNIFSWSLSEVLANYVVVSDNPEELCDGVLEVLYEMEIRTAEPEYELEDWRAYAQFLDKQLQKTKSGKKLITLDTNFSESLSVFVVERADYAALLQLADFFQLKVIDTLA